MKRVGALSSHVTAAAAPMSGAYGGHYDNKYFHFIGEMSPVTESFLVPKSMGQVIEAKKNPTKPNQLKSEDHIQMLIGDGTPRELVGFHAANVALAARYSYPGDDELFPSLASRNAASVVPCPNARVAELVDMIETTPFKDITHKVAEGLRDGKFTHKEGLAAAMVAVNRSCEHCANHHGGPIHPVSGGWAVAWMAEVIAKSGDRLGPAKQWADLPVVQSMSIACRHIENSRKLAGPAFMPVLDLGDRIRAMTDPKAVCKEMGEAVLANHPIRGEKLLVRALQLGAHRDDITTAIMEEAVPRNTVDDHYQLYPNFAFLALDAIGWEFAEPVLRSALRYVTTVSPYGRNYHAEGKNFRDTQFLGGPSDYVRVSAIAESLGLLKEGAVRESPEDPVAERAWSDQLAYELSEDPGEEGGAEANESFMDLLKPGKKKTDVLFERIAVRLAQAMANGMSLEGALNTLSVNAARMFMKQTIGNPMDTHMLNSIGARRNLFAAKGVPARLKVISLMEWASGAEITGGVRATSPREKGGLRNNLYGANRVPQHVEALLAGPNPPPMEPAALLDYISHAICVRDEVQTSFNGKMDTTHDEQMRLLYSGKIGVGNLLCTNEVATKVFPAIWLYANRAGGTFEEFFARMAEHTAMDDYSEMHAWKHVVSCHHECERQPKEHHWLYMASCAKAICNHSGCGHLIFDLASDVLTDLKKPRVPGWHASGIPRGATFLPAEDSSLLEQA